MSEAIEDHCITCVERFEAGEKYYPDVSGGFIHARCCGPEMESYVGKDGERLTPGDPIPEPMIWTEEP